MDLESIVNPVTASLAPYPMEELKKIRKALEAQGKPIYDFGTGDPTLPTWEPIRQAIAQAIPQVSQYPSILGSEGLRQAQYGYLQRRFQLDLNADFDILPSRGSKEAIFHIALSLIGRAGGRRRLLYPNPGYPVYRASALFAGGIPTPVALNSENGYLLEPWRLSQDLVKDVAAVWVNYPHNPTGTMAPLSYWQELVAWCHQHNVVLLADECYVDIYESSFDRSEHSAKKPISPLSLSYDRVLSFFSLSKRSGMTGHRAGFIAGDARILKAHGKARANFGLGQPDYIQQGAAVAWLDDEHVAERRRIFSERMQRAGSQLSAWGLLAEVPQATFYLWCRVPDSYHKDDVRFCMDLAKKGLIASPSSWLGEACPGYFRLALVPGLAEIDAALSILKAYGR